MSRKNPFPFGPLGAKDRDDGQRRRQAHGAYSANDESGLPPYDPEDRQPGGIFAEDGDPCQDAEETQAADPALFLADFAENISDEDLKDLAQKRICPHCTVKKEADDTKLRSLAELENTKKRLVREKDEHVKFAAETILAELLPSLDNLDLALAHADPCGPCKDLVLGIQMTRKLLLEALSKHGLHCVSAIGEEFDPARHEAVGMVNDPNVPSGTVCQMLSCGYQLKDRLLRPAKVLVSKH